MTGSIKQQPELELMCMKGVLSQEEAVLERTHMRSAGNSGQPDLAQNRSGIAD